jgi:hypothetical protein
MSETVDDSELAEAIEAIGQLPLDKRAEALADIEGRLRSILDSATTNP